MNLKTLFKIDPLKSFTGLPLFWTILIFSLVLSTTSAVLIIVNSNLHWRWDSDGFNSFVETFKVPLSILALATTFIVILATIHRSSQTREQIISTNKQNIFSNYYKHIEEFEKYMKAVVPSNTFSLENLRLTHRYLFPAAIEGNYSINKEFLDIIESRFFNIKNSLNKFNQERNETVADLLIETYKEIDKSFSYLHIKCLRGGTQLVQGKDRITVPSNNIFKIVNDIKAASVIIIQILTFDHEIVIPRSLNQVANLITSNEVPAWNFQSKIKFEDFIFFDQQAIHKL